MGGVSLSASLCIHGLFADIDRLRRLLRKCERGDPGVIAAATAHDLSPPMLEEFRRFFSEAVSREALLDILAAGIDLVDWRLKPPTFKAVHDAYRINRQLGIEWPKLRQIGVDTSSARTILQQFRPIVAEAVREYDVKPSQVAPLLYALHSGDLRMIEGNLYSRVGSHDLESATDALLQLIISASELVPSAIS